MKHIAIITSGLIGITNASIELARQLRSEGHRITFLSPINIKEKVVLNELTFVKLPEIDFNFSIKRDLIPAKNRTNILRTYFYHFTHLKKELEEGVIKLKLDDYEAILKTVNPDLVIVDMEVHEAILVVAKLKIKTKLLNQFLFNQKQFNLPSIEVDITPGQGFKGSTLGIELSWIKLRLMAFTRSIARKILLRANRKSILLYYKKKHGLNNLKIESRHFPSDFIYANIDTFHLVMSELEFPLKQPKHINYLGPMVNMDRADSNISQNFKTLIDLKNKHNKKLIYCSLTSMKNKGDFNFIKKVIQSVANIDNWILIISLGRHLNDENSFENLPKNVSLFSWVPQLYILKNCDCSINHGGIHTINECIYFQVPMLIYSGKKYDQDGNSARLVYHNLAIAGDKDKDDASKIKEKINFVLKNELIKENLVNLKYDLNKYKAQKISPYLQ